MSCSNPITPKLTSCRVSTRPVLMVEMIEQDGGEMNRHGVPMSEEGKARSSGTQASAREERRASSRGPRPRPCQYLPRS